MSADLFREERAIDTSWRWFRRNDALRISFSEFMQRVQARCPDADPKYVQHALECRLSRTRARRRKGAAA
jgi:hypothetical protein